MCLGIPGEVIEVVDPAHHLAVVEVAGVRRKVNIGLLEDEGVTKFEASWTQLLETISTKMGLG